MEQPIVLTSSAKSPSELERFHKFEDMFILALEREFGKVTITKELNHVDGRPACLRVYEVGHNGRKIRFRVYENDNRGEAEIKIDPVSIDLALEGLKKPNSVCLGNKYSPRCRHAMGNEQTGVDCWKSMAGKHKKQCNLYAKVKKL